MHRGLVAEDELDLVAKGWARVNPELPSQVLRSVLLSMEARGHEVPPSLVTSASRKSTSWEELSELLESFTAREGSAATQALMQDVASRLSSVRAAAELLGSPRFTYLVLLEAVQGRQSLVNVLWKNGAGGALCVTLELQPGLRPSLRFFQCCAWFIAALPRVRGLSDSRMQVERLSERELTCLITPPVEPALTLAHAETNVRVLARELFRSAETQPPRSTPSSQTLQGRFGLTRAEARVVRRLAEGESMKHIALALEVSLETARTHAKRAMQKTDTHRQAELVSLVLHGER